MDAFEVCVSWIVSCFAKCFETCLHKGTYTTAKYSLFSEEVCFCLYSVCCFKKSCSCSTDCKTVSKCSVPGFSCVILFYCDQTWCSFSCLIFASYCMSWCFWSDHCYIYVCRRCDASEVDVESVCEHQHVTFLKVWFDVFLIHISLKFIVDKDHDDISFLCSFCCCIYFKSLSFCFCP